MPGSQAQGIRKAPAASSFIWPLSIACPVGIGNQAQDPTNNIRSAAGSMQGELAAAQAQRIDQDGMKNPRHRSRELAARSREPLVRDADRRALAKAVT